MHRRTYRRLISAALLGGVLLASCSERRQREAIQPPPTAPLTRPLGYAVVDSSYAQIRDRPRGDAVGLGFYRRGEVVPVSERRSVAEGGVSAIWLYVDPRGDDRDGTDGEPGWIAAADVRLFDNVAKARTAAAGITP